MTLTLEVTGEVIADGNNLTSLILDDRNMLGMDHEALQKIIVQVVKAINTLGKKVGIVAEDNDELQEAMQNLEQQISSFEVRTRECEDTCQELALQLGTMNDLQMQQAPLREELSAAKSEVSKKDLNELVSKLDEVRMEMEATKRTQESKALLQQAKFADIEDTLSRHQDFFDDELETRFTQLDDYKGTMKADFESLRQQVDDNSTRKANKVDVEKLEDQVKTLIEGQGANNKMLTEATQHFTQLDGLTHLVNENQSRMQEMWAQFARESQELREWSSSTWVELRAAVRSKMNELEALSQISEIRKEVTEFGPYLGEALSRMETHLRQKAEGSEVQRLQDDMEMLNRTTGRPNQLLMGTKCLACDRMVSAADTTDGGSVSLTARRQEGELWNEVQRALDKRPDKNGAKDVLKYVAIHVGNPSKGNHSHGFFESRDNKDASPGGHYLMRVGGGGGCSRPVTVDSASRPQPRDPPPIVRVAPRRLAPQVRSSGTVPSVPSTPRDGTRRMPNATVRAALGSMPRDQPSNIASFPAMSSEAPYSPPMQPAAHSGMVQYSATELDSYPDSSEAYIIDGGRSPSPF